MTILKVFYLSTHKTETCVRTADFYCVHSMHRSEFVMCTNKKSCIHTQYALLSTLLILTKNLNFACMHKQRYRPTVQLWRCFERTRICAWLHIGDYLYLRVTRESLANFAQSCAIISQTRKTICQTRATCIRYARFIQFSS